MHKTLTPTLEAMLKWSLALFSNIHNLLHAHHVFNLLVDLGAQARNICLLDDIATTI